MYVRILLGISLSLTLSSLVNADKLIDFRRDVQPVLEVRCLECHGPDKAKNDFRVDDPEMMSYYVEPGDLESSTLWSDYLITDDPELKMPPANSTHHEGMTAAELATIKLWIEEGAEHDWSVPDTKTETEVVEAATPVSELSMPYKVWLFQGLFHPAMTHLPVGLLSISLVFLVLSKFAGSSFESAAFHCLWVGALGACVACVSGWSYATHEGYGMSFSFASDIDRHRWLGVILAIGSLALIPVAYKAVKSEEGSGKMKLGWFLGALLVAMCVSIVGFQGGELVYGEGHYEKEFDHLFLTDNTPAATDAKAVEVEEVVETESSE
ncbi:Planctomycete cytochrome C [Bremerella volcania]|uniref:Planctomycete cytochrome C n=2 Tax=Bremerella volcania TaxID=2527984 RepID=A0A518C639_9BACT|nr:Planctomycete cytochrome C [Bremerella volcania]